MRPILTLRQYTEDLIVHSHDHAQLVFGLSGALDFEVDGRGSQVVQQSFVVVPAGFHHACGSAMAAVAWCWMCRAINGFLSPWAITPMPAVACSTTPGACRWMPGKASW